MGVMTDNSTHVLSRRWRPVKFGVAAFLIALSAGLFVVWVSRPDEQLMIAGSPVVYSSMDELLAQTDVTLMVTVISPPETFVDFGADGDPDYVGQPGMPVELVQVEVTEVLRGDPALKGTTIDVSQPSRQVAESEGSRASDRMKTGQHVLIVASLAQANPGVGERGATIYSPAPGGQGVFDITSDGTIEARVESALGGDIRAGHPVSPTRLGSDDR